MLCSAPELNIPQELYPSVGEEGLLIFNEEYPVGMDIKPIVGLDDAIIDFEILANRPDCMCALGVARESAAALNTSFLAPEGTVKESGGDIKSEVKVSVPGSRPLPALYRARDQERTHRSRPPKWTAQVPDRRGPAPDQQHRGHHKLRDDRIRPPHARV